MCLFCSSCCILLSIFKTLQDCVKLVENCTTAVTLVQNIKCPKQFFISKKIFFFFFYKDCLCVPHIFIYKRLIWNKYIYRNTTEAEAAVYHTDTVQLETVVWPLDTRLWTDPHGHLWFYTVDFLEDQDWVPLGQWSIPCGPQIKPTLGNEEHLRHIPVSLYIPNFNKEMIPTRAVLWPENSNNMCLCSAGRKAWVENRSCCI